MAGRKKRSGWSLKDELELLEKWEARSHDLRRAKRNAHIFNEISQEMAQKYTAEEIHCKVKNLTKKYREEKTKIGPSGGSPSPWRHYNAVNRIVGCTAVNSALYIETYSYSENSTLTQMLSPSDPPLSPSLPSPSPSCPLPPSLPSPSPSSPLPPSLPSPSPSCPLPSPSASSTTRKRNFSAELLKV
ncbi:TANK-binding kinase 1-binding protein 1-like [Bactrocera neohumeralis]|uniref:TANK-binding kinase 1-binding protein 1-like n=1 Tax=Bactrocera neohumeralis TaxID=98809 RepID=UPI002165C7CD|nr:TANK-binding kinase 1-binding protein 1-like [Bactrocera neohumeralis]